MTTSLIMTQPDDFHLHLRDGNMLQDTVKASTRYFSRAIVMPNLTPHVATVDQAIAYKKRIATHIPVNSNFTPLMTLYLTDNTRPEEIHKAKESKKIFGFKLYPAGATTNSDSGVTAIEHIYPAIEAMADVKLPLLVHGEVTHSHIDIFDREKIFIETHLQPLIERFQNLKVILEHITTSEAVQFVENASSNIAATITPQHLLFNRNHLLVGKIKPHLYCLPILKRSEHQKALLKAATSGNPKFFLGTDSAPHAQTQKENACGCAGCFSAHNALEFYAEAFEAVNALDKLEAFASFYGADFYGLPRNTKKITLNKVPSIIPAHLQLGSDIIIPLNAGQAINWSVTHVHKANKK